MKKQALILPLFILAVAISIVLTTLKLEYLYNPITFKKDMITTYNWSQYKEPLRIEYYYLDEDRGWTLVNTVQDKDEIRFIFNELKSNMDYKYTKEDFIASNEQRDKLLYVVIRHMTSPGRGLILRQFNLYEQGNVVDLGNMEYRKISEELKNLILRRLFDDEYVDKTGDPSMEEREASDTNKN